MKIFDSQKLRGFVVLGVVAACACAGPAARVGAVWATRREHTVEVADRGLFLTDRSSHYRIEPHPLPRGDQREEFYVDWTGRDVNLVRFEYRQLRRPDQILKLDHPTHGRGAHLFEVRGDDYQTGGMISAWRVSLWRNDQLQAEKKSSLW